MISKKFEERFGSAPAVIVRSPGRINVIGEHTDYNEGFVLPAAIDKYVTAAVSKTDGDEISLFSIQYNENFGVKLADIKPVPGSWTNYVLGVVDQLIRRGYSLTGFNMAIDGNVPLGSGLSSSAAIECAVCRALSEVFDLDLEKFDVVKISQKAEHTFPGVQCGIMDQFASVFGKQDHALKLDCRSLDYEEVPLQLKGYKIVLLNTNVSHSLASTEYNTRRRECTEGVNLVKVHHPEVNSLRDVTVDMIHSYISDPLINKRCLFIVEENERVQRAVAHMREGDIQGLGNEMYRSHAGLSKEYEVSCKELDWLVEAVKDNENVAGARMMGGGFGGCTINIVKEDAIDALSADLTQRYKAATGLDLTVYIAATANGTEKIN